MALQLYMVGLIAHNMEKSLQFYRQLGVDFPAGSEGKPHIEVKMNGELTFFLNVPGRVKELDDTRIVLEFYLQERSAVDEKYNELVGLGFQSHHAPFVSSLGMYFATINDPDGNTVLLSAD